MENNAHLCNNILLLRVTQEKVIYKLPLTPRQDAEGSLGKEATRRQCQEAAQGKGGEYHKSSSPGKTRIGIKLSVIPSGHVFKHPP